MALPVAGDVPLLAVGPDDQLPESRIRDGWHAHAIYRRLDWYDSASEAQRANIDYMIDGGKPYSEKAMIDAGRGEDANVNFMEAKAEDDMAQTPFIEMTTVSQKLWNIRSLYGDEKAQARNSNIISEEFTRTVRDWGEDFDYQRLRLAQQFTRHGPAYLYWEDEFDWRWRADGPTAFKLPRNTESRASAIPYCVCKRTMNVEELYHFIRDEKSAREVGRWNVDAVKRALVASAFESTRPWTDYSWEEFVAEAKENDFEFGSRGQQVRVFHLWCREFDGQVSHYIGLQNGVVMENGTIIDTEGQKKNSYAICENGFLYAHRCRFPSFESCIIPFFYSIGTHGTIHTIRAQGEMNFAPIAIANRTRCKMIDCAGASSSIILQGENASEAEGAAYRQFGAFMILSGQNKITATAMPDVAARVQPVLDEMARCRQAISPNSVSTNAVDKSKQPQNKYQVQAGQNKDASLSSAILTQFFGPWGRVGKEMFRRMMNKDLSEKHHAGAKQAFAFIGRCLARGVPRAAMDPSLCIIDAVRTIGNGSAQVRQYAAEQVWELADTFDENGRKKALLDVVASIPGVDYSAAADYVGPMEPRKTWDDTAADLENGIFRLGGKQPVETDQNHWVHCQHHQQLVQDFVEAFEQGQMDGSKLVPTLDAALDNMLAHSKELSKDHTREKEAAEVRKFIEQNGGILQQQQQKLIAAMQREQEAQRQPQEGGQQPDPGEDRKAQIHAQKIQQMQQELDMKQRLFQQELEQQEATAKQKRSIANLEAAQRIAQKGAETASEAA